jgi:plasmid stabilization system protein ParE
MKRFRLIVSPPAEADIAAAYEYIFAESPAYAARWRSGLLTASERLRRIPMRCRIAPESPFCGAEIRQLTYGRYRILFTIQGDTVLILHVRHAARRAIGPDEST